MRYFLLFTLFIGIIVEAEESEINEALNTEMGVSVQKKSTFEFFKWRFTRTEPDRVAIEISDDWKSYNLTTQLNYTVWIGHSTFLVNNGDITLLFDPMFSKYASPVSFIGPRRLIDPALQIDDLPKIDIVAISHNHYDHLDIPSLKAIHKTQPETVFLVPKGDKKLLNKHGIKNVQEFDWWESFEIKNSLFHFVPVKHWSARTPWDTNESLWGGWIVANANFNLFHAGDTGYAGIFKEIKEKFTRIDYAFIPIGAYSPRNFMKNSHVTPEEALQVSIDMGVKKSFGMHWGTFILSDEPVMDPKVQIEAKRGSLDFEIAIPGKVYPLN
ncbi:MAG: MBL fold metallo-hydrolase [Gammaproteobacteria bacterium]